MPYEIDWIGTNRQGEDDAGCITIENARDVEQAISRAKYEIADFDVSASRVKITHVRTIE